MAQKAKDILIALKTRLQTTGYPVVLGGQVTDEQSDTLPKIVVAYRAGQNDSEVRGGEGKTARRGNKTRCTLRLAVNVIGVGGDTDPLLTAEDWDDAISDALWPHQEKGDDLTDKASDVYLAGRVIGEQEGSNTTVNKQLINITYLREKV